MLDLTQLNELSELILYNIHKVEDGEFAQKVVDNSDNLNLEHKQLFVVCAEYYDQNNKYPDMVFLRKHGADFLDANIKDEKTLVDKEFSADIALDFGNRIHKANVQIDAQQALQLGELEEVERLISTVKRTKKRWDLTIEWEFEMKDQEWLVEECMPQGRVVYLAGRGNIGKSRLSLQLACGVAMGRPEWLEGGPLLGTKRPRNVVYVSYEDTKTDIKRRFPHWTDIEKINNHFFTIDPEGAEFWNNKTTKAGEQTDFFKFVTQCCEKKEAALLIIDPLAAAFLGNENNRMEVRDFMSMLDRWAIKSNCTVLIIAHPPKDKDHDWSGSTDWLNASRAVWIMGKRTRDQQGRPKKKGRNEQDVPEAVCLLFEKNSYGKMLNPLWLKDEYPIWQATDFFNAAYEQMTDEQREEEQKKRNNLVKEVDMESSQDTSPDIEQRVSELDEGVWDESTIEQITKEVYEQEEVEKAQTIEVAKVLTKFGWTSKQCRRNGKKAVYWFAPVSE